MVQKKDNSVDNYEQYSDELNVVVPQVGHDVNMHSLLDKGYSNNIPIYLC